MNRLLNETATGHDWSHSSEYDKLELCTRLCSGANSLSGIVIRIPPRRLMNLIDGFYHGVLEKGQTDVLNDNLMMVFSFVIIDMQANKKYMAQFDNNSNS